MPTLDWIGKDRIVNHHLDVPYHVLDMQYTFGADESENMIIHGDNLVALKALLPKYEGRIKCIYIDPPDLFWHLQDTVYEITMTKKGEFVIRVTDENYDKSVRELYDKRYVEKWDNHNPETRPWLHGCELPDAVYVRR